MQNFVFVFILLKETCVVQKYSKETFFTDVVTRSSFISSLLVSFCQFEFDLSYVRKYKRTINYVSKITYVLLHFRKNSINLSFEILSDPVTLIFHKFIFYFI